MDNFLLGVIVGVIGGQVASHGKDHGFSLYMRLTEWRNVRRFSRFEAKASIAGFGTQFAEEWHRLGMDDPRCMRGMECEVAFQRARRRFETISG